MPKDIWPKGMKWKITRIDGEVEYLDDRVSLSTVLDKPILIATTGNSNLVAYYSLAGIYKWERRS